MLVLTLHRGDVVEILLDGVVVGEITPMKGRNLSIGFRGEVRYRRKNAKNQEPRVDAKPDKA